MAEDKLIFPVGFDLDKGVEEVLKQVPEAMSKIENAISKRQPKVKVDIDSAEIDEAAERFEDSIEGIKDRIKELNKLWNSMSFDVKFDENNNLSNKAQKIYNEFAQLTNKLSEVGLSLQAWNKRVSEAASNNTLSEELINQSKRVSELQDRIKSLDQQLAQLNASGKMYTPDGDYSNEAISLLQKRIELTKRLSQETITGGQAQVILEKKIQEEKRKTTQEEIKRAKEEEKARKKAIDAANKENKRRQAVINEQRRRGLETQRILKAEENSLNAINAKLKIQQERLKDTKFGSEKFKKIAAEVSRLSTELSKANARLAAYTNNSVRKQKDILRSIQMTNEGYNTQSTYISRLLARTAVLFSIGAAIRFAQSIREITAEFELQRVSLGAIIRDTEKANELFNQIQTFAVQSPFEIKDLVSYVKQLSAYRIETEDLFDTTKRLADVSAGLSIDMSRLILAYGQVKAASVLRGTELRQFTEAGIPLIELLAEKFTQLRGELVTTGEVFDLISQRAVSFEMVKEIFEDMTNAGGMFYNMQEKQAATLAGQWSNLKDAYAIMLDEIGNTSVVRKSMEGLISITKELMQNWRSVAKVMEGVSLSAAVLIVSYKNLAISAEAVRKVSKLLNLAHKQAIIQTPKYIAALIGVNKANKLSTILTKAHTRAVLKHATATNVLTKSFWKLTAAMLANPWGIALAAVVGLGYAIFRLATNTETVEERIKSLNESVGAMSQFNKSVTPLVETYDELSKKLNRTAEEEKKLKEVTQELAKRYPGAVKEVKKYGEEIDILNDKLRDLYKAEEEARESVLEKELEKTEKRIKEEEAKINELQEKLRIGTKEELTVDKSGNRLINRTVALNNADKQAIIEQINEIRTGSKDGNGDGGLVGLYNTANQAMSALGLLPSVAAKNIDSFGAWKKTLQGFSTALKTSLGVRNIRLFDDTTISQFDSFASAMDSTAEVYKKNIDLINKYNKTLDSGNITEAERENITAARDEAQAMADMAHQVLNIYNQLGLIQSEGGGGAQTDKRLSNLKEELSILEKVYSRYKEYIKYISQSEAQARINKEFGKTLDIFKKYGIELPKTSKEYQEALKKIQDIMRTLPDSEKEVIELGFKIEDVDWSDAKDKIEKELKRLSDEVSRTKTAKEFFDRMLNITGDRKLSADITLSVYGDTGDGLKQRIIDQIRNLFKTTTGEEIDLEGAINTNTLEINYMKLALLADKYKDIIIEGNKTALDNIIKAGLEATAARIENWEKEIQEEQSYSEKRIRLAQETSAKIADIEASEGLGDNKERLIKGYRNREQKQAAALAWDAFKDSPMYVRMFDNLETASKSMLDSMLERLKQLKTQWGKSLAPTELKELQSRINEIETQIAAKNPFKVLSKAIKDYITLTKNKSYKEAVEELTDNMKKSEDAANDYEKSLLVAQKAEEEYIKIKKEKGEDSQETKNARAIADAAWDEARAKKETSDAARKNYEESQNTVNAYEDIANKAAMAALKIGEWTDKINVAFDGIRNLMDAFGASEEDKQFFEDLVGGFNKVSEGAQQGAMAVSSFMEGDILGGITSVIGAIGNIVSGITNIFYAGMIKRANKEIKRQQEIIDALSYSYERLQAESDKLFGGEFVKNFRDQQNNLRAQIAATEKQLAAERSKGKKADEDKIKDYQETIRDLHDQIEDMQGTLAEHMLGSDLAGAARTFAQSWLDAYKEFGDTRKAIEESMQDMMENLITEAVLGGIAKQILEPLYTYIDQLDAGDFSLDSTWKKIYELQQKAQDEMNAGLGVGADYLEKMGLLTRDMGGDLTGISKDIATASEESILGLTSGINTQNYYMSHIDATVSQMLAIMQGGSTDFTTGESMTNLITVQNQHLAYLPTIAQNTADIVARAERAAVACENIASNLDRVIKPVGVKGSYQVNTSI